MSFILGEEEDAVEDEEEEDEERDTEDEAWAAAKANNMRQLQVTIIIIIIIMVISLAPGRDPTSSALIHKSKSWLVPVRVWSGLKVESGLIHR